jgi:hypothetical protein
VRAGLGCRNLYDKAAMAIEKYLNPGENVILWRRKSRMATLARFVLLVVLLLVSLAIIGAMPFLALVVLPFSLPVAYGLCPTLGVVYTVTNQRVLSVGGWLWHYTEEMPLERAARVEIRQPLLARLIGAGHLVFDPVQALDIEAATMTLVFVPHPHEFRRCILEQRDMLAKGEVRQRVALAIGLQDRAMQSLAAELQNALPDIPMAQLALPVQPPAVPPPPPAAANTSAVEWYYACNGQRHGPVASSELQRLAGMGVITPQDHVWKQGMKDWAPAAKVKGLFLNMPSPTRKNKKD